jgi:hypothetical protein
MILVTNRSDSHLQRCLFHLLSIRDVCNHQSPKYALKRNIEPPEARMRECCSISGGTANLTVPRAATSGRGPHPFFAV